MKGMSGLDLLKKSRAKYPDVCFVMLSALNDVATVAEAVKFGADDYIVKPCAMDYLQSRLEIALERRQQAGPGQIIRKVDTQAIADDLAEQRAALFKNA
jgi:DNA-binding response OmpR family regulator